VYNTSISVPKFHLATKGFVVHVVLKYGTTHSKILCLHLLNNWILKPGQFVMKFMPGTSHYNNVQMEWSVVAEWLGCRTLNQRVMGSNPDEGIAKARHGICEQDTLKSTP
jgi:hypothetical protein